MGNAQVDGDLSDGRFYNMIRILANRVHPRRDEALALRDIVSSEYRLRAEKRGWLPLSSTSNSVCAPKCGILAYLSYHVGNHMTPTAERRLILEYVVEYELPAIVSREYYSSWDRPGMPQRLRKLLNAIGGFVTGASGDAAKSKAIREWEDDLKFLRQRYRYLDGGRLEGTAGKTNDEEVVR